jgi:hypothetical protein
MIVVLDFDHTLYDTSSLVEDLATIRSDDVFVRENFWDQLDAKQYIYPDVLPFLQSKAPTDFLILTAVTPSLGPESEAFQKRKVFDSGLDELVSEVIFMVGDKGPYVEQISSAYDSVVVFIDDKFEHLISVKTKCPDVVCLQMVRNDLENRKNDFDNTVLSNRSDIKAVRDFNEVTEILNAYE